MSSTLKAERNAVRFRLNDLNIGNAILQADLVDAAVQDVYLMMVGEGLAERLWDITSIAMAEGQSEYVVPYEVADLIAVRISSSSPTNPGAVLDRIDPVAIKALLRDEAQAFPATGTPNCYAVLYTGMATTDVFPVVGAIIYLYPIPNEDYTGIALELLKSTIPTALVLDTDIVGLSRSGLAALREIAAGRIAKKLGPKMLEKLDLPPDLWQQLQTSGDRMLYDEKARLNRQWQPNAPKRPGWPVVA